ncbi:HTH_Tnp_Tc3_2 domain-containing protein [Trichonephila clavipes]|nr:HTH_Tnp_Tc3_2 domain-containing protein [Trichonephila clavipes]
MDITPRKRSKIIACNEHISMTVRDVATAVGVNKSRILRTFLDSETSYPKRKVKCDCKRKTTPRTDKVLIRNIKINPKKNSIDLWKNLLEYSVEMSSLTLRKRLLKVALKATRPEEQQLLTQKIMVKRL